MPNPKNYWCSEHTDGWWYVQQEGAAGYISKHQTQAPAWEETKRLARASKGEAFLKGKDGKIRERNSYGDDPYPPRG